MRIILMTTGLGVGGAEQQVCGLADYLSALGNEIRLVCLTGHIRRQPSDKRVIVCHLRMTKNPFSVIRAVWRANCLIREFRPAVVHSHMIHANIFARLLRLFCPIPRLICSAHSTNEGSALRMYAYRITDFLADLSTNVSNSATAEFIRRGAVPQARMKVMYNGIDINHFSFCASSRLEKRERLGISSEEPLFLSVGRLVEAKDHANLLRAFSSILSKVPTAYLALIGEGPLRADLMRLAKQLGITHRTTFLGVQDDINGWMSASDIFVLSSAWEGFGLVVAEAMSCSRIVVATDAGGIKEVLGPFGFMVPPRNSDALAKGLLKAQELHSSGDRAMGDSARIRVRERFSLKRITDEWMKVYQNI